MRRKNAPSRLFGRIENESLSNAAVAQIEDLILSGVLREGDLLPGERELAEQFGISRPKVREAISQLVNSKLLKIQASEGTYVAKLGGEVMSPALIDLFNRSSSAIRDNLEYRREKEGFASRLAAQRATESDRAELLRIINAMESADTSQDTKIASKLDLELHHAIAFAAHNRTLTHMMTALYNLNRSSLFYNREELLNIDKAGEELFKQHRTIVDAICQAKPVRAEKAAHKHIEYVASLVENEFERRSREAMSSKRNNRRKQAS